VELRQAQIQLFRKYAHLYDSGVPLAEALELARAGLGEPLDEAVGGVVEDLYRGSSLADALTRRPACFGADIVGILRAGEQRGELGSAARSAAEGLEGAVLAPSHGADEALDALLAAPGARILHLGPGPRLHRRTAAGVADGGTLDAAGLIAALAGRARIRGGAGAGAFLHGDVLVRVALASTPAGPAAVVRLAGPPGAEPPEARAWREGRPGGVLLVTGGRHDDTDGCLWSVLQAFGADARRVTVDLPVPGVVCVPTVAAAVGQDPDVLAAARVADAADAQRLAAAAAEGVRVAAVAPPHLFPGVPVRTVRAPGPPLPSPAN